MSSLIIEEFSDFTFASNRAKELTELFKTSIKIARCANGWAILAPKNIKTAILVERGDLYDEYKSYYPNSDDYQENPFQSISDEIREELCDYVHSQARSEEDGWYYSDED